MRFTIDLEPSDSQEGLKRTSRQNPVFPFKMLLAFLSAALLRNDANPAQKLPAEPIICPNAPVISVLMAPTGRTTGKRVRPQFPAELLLCNTGGCLELQCDSKLQINALEALYRVVSAVDCRGCGKSFWAQFNKPIPV